MSRLALAQPASDPYPAPLPPQEPVVVEPPPPVQPALLLAPDEVALLQRGEIDSDLHILGIVANAVVSFGVGQAVQGRWSESGWKFTAGVGGGMVLFFAGADRSGGLQFAGAAILATFYIWGIVDAATGPTRHNARIREIKLRHGIPLAMPYVSNHDGGGTAGLVLRF